MFDSTTSATQCRRNPFLQSLGGDGDGDDNVADADASATWGLLKWAKKKKSVARVVSTSD
jgi:hypothetical protein